MKKLTLSVVDRVILLNVLPKEGNMVTLLALRQLKEDLVFSEAESAKLDVKMEDGNLFWNKEEEQGKIIEMGSSMRQLVVDAFTKMDQEKTLNEAMIDTYQKFIK